MIDSTNVRVLADNIRKLQGDSSGLASRVTALEVTAPKDYSTTETATGQKWIDGKDIYKIVISENMGEATSGQEVLKILPSNLNIISMSGRFIDSTYHVLRYLYNYYYDPSNGAVYLGKNSNMISTNCTIILYYTKPDPTPGRAPEDEPEEVKEPEEKKTTKKKSSK